jgi:2-oxo-4-hydroxy-4-carboxy-5-ureidoimidazoline decarboxylase
VSGPAGPGVPDAGAFNAMPVAQARERLLVCLDVPRWADTLVAGRPFANLEEIDAAARAGAAVMSDDELERALARHPRIGERADAARHDAEHSAGEQSGVDAGDLDTTRALAEGNRAYEERFGRVFIIRAAGRDAQQILDRLRRRLDHSDEHERAETIEQLTQIALLRLREVLG